ncbi:MAG: nuclear transport factor 2 family protein, partial [Pyrinomonadaceae bacterium]|nr:nuclear transport factor 2 family protein [Pyrinomonadaceae bacterium]
LTRANDNPRGRFTLLLRRTAQGWRIVHDHTSSASS